MLQRAHVRFILIYTMWSIKRVLRYFVSNLKPVRFQHAYLNISLFLHLRFQRFHVFKAVFYDS